MSGHDVLYRWKLLIIKIHYAVYLMRIKIHYAVYLMCIKIHNAVYLMWKVLELVGKASNYMNKARMLFHL